MERKPSVVADPRIKKKSYSLSASDYKLLEEIGKGVSAFVYRARCIPLNEFIAIKALNLDGCDSNNLDNIRREVQTMSLISHPNVVKAYCSFMVEKSLWVVMPFMAGGSCLHIMKAAYPDGFEEPIIASFLKETLKALEYLHHQGYIHRDVKAGNILVDGNGAIKLGDFGVSACMFNTWDRQRSRNTFGGTPCWMAPEVMEQVHGYDFKADIWSFGITALELAHGHAPFSKYPPVKVLLMTLQNAPPSFDYERDKRFSKSFKEMVAMCLVKDPSKRPSAEKLLKHSFFKHAKTADYIARTILDPLPPLWERVQDVKMRDVARLAEKKMPYGEQEARSQNEYKRGVSSWNFDLEDLKAQSALNEVEPPVKDYINKDRDVSDINSASSPPFVPSQQTMVESNSCQSTGGVYLIEAEIANSAYEHANCVWSGPLPPKPCNDSKPWQPLTGKKEPKHFGRFDVFDDDPEQDILESCNGNGGLHNDVEKENVSTVSDTDQSIEFNHAEERDNEQDNANQKYNHSSTMEGLNDTQKDRGLQPIGKSIDDDVGLPQPSNPAKVSTGPSILSVTCFESHCPNGMVATTKLGDHKSQKEPSEEKLKGQAVFQKGRFSVTSQDEDIQEHGPNSRKYASIQISIVHKSASLNDGPLEQKHAGPSTAATSGLNATTLIQTLQTLLSQTALQQELIVNLLNSVNPSEQPLSQKSSSLTAKNISRNAGLISLESKVSFVVASVQKRGNDQVANIELQKQMEMISERERNLLSQVGELQCRATVLVEELQVVKLRNVQLERQLNAIFNKEEEERIRKEEAANDDD